jgi:hypothetical protein
VPRNSSAFIVAQVDIALLKWKSKCPAVYLWSYRIITTITTTRICTHTYITTTDTTYTHCIFTPSTVTITTATTIMIEQ